MEMEPKYKITTEDQATDMLARIDTLMRKGELNVTVEESLEIRAMGEALQTYERHAYGIS